MICFVEIIGLVFDYRISGFIELKFIFVLVGWLISASRHKGIFIFPPSQVLRNLIFSLKPNIRDLPCRIPNISRQIRKVILFHYITWTSISVLQWQLLPINWTCIALSSVQCLVFSGRSSASTSGYPQLYALHYVDRIGKYPHC